MLIGAASAIGGFCISQAYRASEAALVAPFEYLAMIFAAIVGFVFWGEIPVFTTWLGGLVMMAGFLKELGVVAWFADNAQSWVAGLSPILVAVALILVYFFSLQINF